MIIEIVGSLGVLVAVAALAEKFKVQTVANNKELENSPKWVLVCNDGHSTSVLGLFGSQKLAVKEMENYVVEAIRDFKDDFPDDPIEITRDSRWQDNTVAVNDVTWQTGMVQETFR